MKSILRFLAVVTVAFPLSALAQTLFSPNGTVGSISPNNGNVGVGTSAPASKLDVNGSFHAQQGGFGRVPYSNWPLVAQGFGVGFIETSGQNAITLLPAYNGFNYVVSDYFSGTTRLPLVLSGRGTVNDLVLDTSGNIGIGTAAPTEKLQVAGNVRQVVVGRIDNELTDSSAPLNAKVWSWSLNGAMGANVFGLLTRDDAGVFGQAALRFTRAGANITDASFPNGNVGIGTPSPTARLEVNTGGGASGQTGLYVFHSANSGSDVANFTSNWLDGNGGNLLRVANASGSALTITSNRDIGIGTSNPTEKLSVNGAVRAKEVIVDTGWSDYVFDESYKLKALSETEAFIKAEKHLPGIPSASEVAEKGISLGDMQAKLLAKIEELTLHVIAQEKLLSAQQTEIRALQLAAKIQHP